MIRAALIWLALTLPLAAQDLPDWQHTSINDFAGLLSDDDTVVPSPNSVNYYLALKQHGIKATMHIYPSGGHGWGIRKNFKYHKEMLADLSAWLDTLK